MIENTEIYILEEIGAKTGTVFKVYANNNRDLSINALFNTGASKSVMSHETFRKLKLDKLDSHSIPHIVGASGESLGTLDKTRCEIRINNRTFYQTFIVGEHLKDHLRYLNGFYYEQSITFLSSITHPALLSKVSCDVAREPDIIFF